MLMTTPARSLGIGCEVAIEDLPIELRLMRNGELYCVGTTDEADAHRLIDVVLQNADPLSRAALISTTDPSRLLTDSAPAVGPAEIRFYKLVPGLGSALRSLAKDLDRRLRPRNRMIVLLVPADAFPNRAEEFRRLLVSWREWLSQNQCTILLVLHGPSSAELARIMLPSCDVLSGLAALVSEGARRLYRVLHWRNALAVTGLTEFPLVDASTGYRVRQQEAGRAVVAGDAHTFYIERAVLEGASVFMAKEWHAFDSAQQVFEHAMLANAATVVFALNSSEEISEQARRLYALRRQRGRALKLVLREMRRSLRYPDEQLLLACGANLVVPSEIPLPRFFSLLENVQGQTYTHELVSDLERQIERSRPPSLQGIMVAQEFLAQMERMVEQFEEISVEGILVQMIPVPGLSVVHALEQLNLRRSGDAACAMDDAVYLFLYGCRPALVDAALANIFRLSYREMFSEHAVYLSPTDIRLQLSHMRRSLLEPAQRPAGLAFVGGGIQTSKRARHESLTSVGGIRPVLPTLGVFQTAALTANE